MRYQRKRRKRDEKRKKGDEKGKKERINGKKNFQEKEVEEERTEKKRDE